MTHHEFGTDGPAGLNPVANHKTWGNGQRHCRCSHPVGIHRELAQCLVGLGLAEYDQAGSLAEIDLDHHHPVAGLTALVLADPEKPHPSYVGCGLLKILDRHPMAHRQAQS